MQLLTSIGTVGAVIVALLGAFGVFRKINQPRVVIKPLKADIRLYDKFSFVPNRIDNNVIFVRFPLVNVGKRIAKQVMVKLINVEPHNGDIETLQLTGFEPFKLMIVGGHNYYDMHPHDKTNKFDLLVTSEDPPYEKSLMLLNAPDDNPANRGFSTRIKRWDYDFIIGVFGENIKPHLYKITLNAKVKHVKDIKAEVNEIKL